MANQFEGAGSAQLLIADTFIIQPRVIVKGRYLLELALRIYLRNGDVLSVELPKRLLNP